MSDHDTGARADRLADVMRERELDCLLVTRIVNVRYLTGFTGSAGRAIVLAKRAVVFVDGRYTLQARDQVDGALFDVVLVSETTPES